MQKKINFLTKLNFEELLIIFFPISILLRSASLNIYMVFCCLYFLFKLNKLNFIDFSKNNKWIFVLFVFFCYSLINSFNAEYFQKSLVGSISILKFFLFSLFIATINLKKENINFIINTISVILVFVCIDTIIQFTFGKDIFGFEIIQLGRLSGPFGDELIVGAFLTYISIPISAFFFENIKNEKNWLKFYNIFFILFIYFTVLISGERMNFIILSCCYFLIMIRKSNFRTILISFFCFLFFSILMVNFNDGLKIKYKSFYEDISNFKNSNHGKLLSSSYNIWEQNKIFGTGLKNYKKLCDTKNFDKYTNDFFVCSTHPHNLYFEILTESGLIGLLIFLFFIFVLMKKILNSYEQSDEVYKSVIYGAGLVIFFYIWPLRSSGSFFSTFNGSFFWFNLGMIILIAKNNSKLKKN